MSLIETAFASLGQKFRELYTTKNRGTAKKNAKQCCGKCDQGTGKWFPAGTPVHTADGLQPIEEIQAEDLVWSFDVETEEWHLAKVLEAYEIDYEGDLVTLQLPDETITATGGHPFWVFEGEGLEDRPVVEELIEDTMGQEVATATATETGRWVSARDLQAGDIVLGRDGEHHEILSTEVEQDARLKTYNLLVEQLHTYAVGAMGIVVHNTSPSACKIKCGDKKPTAQLVKRCKNIKTTKKLDKCEEHRKTVLDDCASAIKRRRSQKSSSPLTANEEESCPKDPNCCDGDLRKEKCPPAKGTQPSFGGVAKIAFKDAQGVAWDGFFGRSASTYLTSSDGPFARTDFTETGWFTALRSPFEKRALAQGHILASSLGGPGKNSWKNLTPLFKAANDPAMRTCEGFLAKLASECGYCVDITITPRGYGENPHAPENVRPVFPKKVEIKWVDRRGCGSDTIEIENSPNVTTPGKCSVVNLPCRKPRS